MDFDSKRCKVYFMSKVDAPALRSKGLNRTVKVMLTLAVAVASVWATVSAKLSPEFEVSGTLVFSNDDPCRSCRVMDETFQEVARTDVHGGFKFNVHQPAPANYRFEDSSGKKLNSLEGSKQFPVRAITPGVRGVEIKVVEAP